MDLEQIKIATSLSIPLVKELVERYISPKIRELVDKKVISVKITAHSFENQFETYLIQTYNKYATPSVLALDNQKRLLKDIYVPLEVINTLDSNDKHVIDKFNDDFIPANQKVLIIDTAGMGKSTISKWLFLMAVEQRIGVPILIELRRLKNNAKIIDEIIRQLSLINEEADKDFVLELISRGGFIFMLDGFDEIEHDYRSAIVEDIRNFIDKAGKNYYLLTSRPEGALGAFGDFVSYKIRALRKSEAYTLLGNYDNKGSLSTLLISKLEERENEAVKEFLTNPLLVSLLYAAFDYKNIVPLKKHMFYRQVYDAFFENHDLNKGDSYIRSKFSKLESDDFYRVLRFIGYYSMSKNKIEFNKDEIINVITEAKKFCVNLVFAASDFLKDILIKVPLFVEDGLYIKWAHKSIQEYFAANFIFSDAKDKQGRILTAIYKSNSYKYYNVMDIYYSIDPKSFRRYITYNFALDYIEALGKLRNIWANIDEASASALFISKFIVGKVEYNNRGVEMFNKLNEYFDFQNYDTEWGSYAMFHENEAKYKYLKVFSTENRGNLMLSFLSSKNTDFIKRVNAPRKNFDENLNPVSSFSYLKIKKNNFYKLDINDADDVFKVIDINTFFSQIFNTKLCIDENKIKQFIKSVETEIKVEQADDFLMAGLE